MHCCGFGGTGTRQKRRRDVLPAVGVQAQFVRDNVTSHVRDTQMDATVRGDKLLEQAKRIGSTARTGDANEEGMWSRSHLSESSTPNAGGRS